MTQRPYQIDHVILSADRSRWREELHSVLHRRGQEDWMLVALLNGSPEEVQTRQHDSSAGTAGLTLIFQRQV